jgi:hypothetical protein
MLMKVQTLKALIFISALMLGLIASWKLGLPAAEGLAALEPPLVSQVEVPLIVPPTVRRQEFRPEFFDLQNFDEDAPSPRDGNLIELFEGGIYRRSETYAESGQNWLALTANDSGQYTLKDLTASVKLLNSVSWPGDEKDARLTFNTSRRIVFAVRDIAGVKSGPVLTLFEKPSGSLNTEGFSDNEELSNGYRREFIVGSNLTLLRTSHGVSKDGTKMAALVVESGGKIQVVKRIYHVSSDDRDIIGSLYWVGDLDRDGKLDFYLSEFNEKGYTLTELFLSSFAKDGQLVGLAASFGAAGC